MKGKKSAKNVKNVAPATDEEYSVDEIANLLTANKRRGKKVAVEVENLDVAEKPKGRGKKVAARIEPTQETVNGVAADSNGDASEPQAKRGRGKKAPTNVAEEIKETEATVATTKGRGKKTTSSEEDLVTNGVETAPKTNSRRGKKAAVATETVKENGTEVEIKATRVRGKKAAVESQAKPVEEIENEEPAKVTKRRGKTAVITNKQETNPVNIPEEAVEEIEAPKKPAAKRGNKKQDVKMETELVASSSHIETATEEAEIQEPIKNETNKKSKRTRKPQAEVVIDKKPRSNRNKAKPVETAPHITADEEPAEEVVEKKSRKRAAPKAAATEEEETAPEKILKNATVTEYDESSFAVNKKYTLKISSWNVAGMRSWLKKEGLKFLQYEQPDIFCLQETKCDESQLPKEAVNVPGYHRYWLCMPGGYAGVAIYSRIMPIHVEYGIGDEEFDKDGRIITAEYEKFYLINVYVPNSGRKLVNLDTRMNWEQLFLAHVQRYDKLKPVIICGDMNVSHLEIDLANPKANTRNAGFTAEEREKMTELLGAGFVDTFRYLYPKQTGAYTFWTYMGNARKRNVGWRLDYFITSERFLPRVVDQVLRSNVLGSDHCPLTLLLNI